MFLLLETLPSRISQATSRNRRTSVFAFSIITVYFWTFLHCIFIYLLPYTVLYCRFTGEPSQVYFVFGGMLSGAQNKRWLEERDSS